MQHPSTPRGGLVAPQGFLSLVPSPSPYQCLMWRLVPPPIGSAMVHPPPLLLAWLWHLKHANLIAGPAWWPGALALGFSHLPHCPGLVV